MGLTVDGGYIWSVGGRISLKKRSTVTRLTVDGGCIGRGWPVSHPLLRGGAAVDNCRLHPKSDLFWRTVQWGGDNAVTVFITSGGSNRWT